MVPFSSCPGRPRGKQRSGKRWSPATRTEAGEDVALGRGARRASGGREESISRVPDMINGADAVICPTDCVIHTAYYLLKPHCKRTGKPCLLLKGAGVSGFAVALAQLSGGRITLSGNATKTQ